MMKEHKTDKPALAPDPRFPTEEPGNLPRSDAKMMQAESQLGTPRGRLSAEVRHKLGEKLQAMFDGILKEGVPERFAKLLTQLEGERGGAPAGEPDPTKKGG